MSKKNSTPWTDKHITGKGYIPDGRGGYIPVGGNHMVMQNPGTAPVKHKTKGRGKFRHVKKNHAGMNKTEAAYAQHLDALKLAGDVIDYWFEGVTLKLAHDTRLTPDFMVQMRDGFIRFVDVKGSKFMYMDDAKVKMKVAADRFPMEFYVVFPKPQKEGGGWTEIAVHHDTKQ